VLQSSKAYSKLEYPAENNNHAPGVCYYLHVDTTSPPTDAQKQNLPQHGQYVILSRLPRVLWKVDRRVPYNANAYAHSDFKRLICHADGSPVVVPGIEASDSSTWVLKQAGTWSYSVRTEKECTQLQVWKVNGQNLGGQGSASYDEIKCRLPLGAGAQNNINIYWGGVPLVLKNWFHYSAPSVDSLSPSSGDYAGGSVVTIHGSNFGSPDLWRHYTAGDSSVVRTRTGSKQVGVELITRSPVSCSSVQYVNSGTLLCTLPALPETVVTVDKTARTVSSRLAVVVKSQRSAAKAGSNFLYTGVPAYYGCDNTAEDSVGKNTCFTCCRHECVLDEFAAGGKRGGHTYSHCDRACYRFCGYLSRRRTSVRRLLWARAKARAMRRRV